MTEITTKSNSLRDAFTKKMFNSSKAKWIRFGGKKFFITDRFKEIPNEDHLCVLCGKPTTGFLGIVETDEIGSEELMAFQGDHCCGEIAFFTIETEIRMEPEIHSVRLEPNLVKLHHDNDITKKFITNFMANTQEILPPKLLLEIEELVLRGSFDVNIVIDQIKNIQDDDTRLFALLVIHSIKGVDIECKKKTFAAFINDSCINIKYHMVLFAGIYKIAECIPTLQKFTKKSNELIQCTSFWSLTRLEKFTGFTDKLAELLSKIQSERGFYFIVASLFLINCEHDSKEMKILREFYFTHFFDEENETFIQEIEHVGGEQLSVFISSLLLKVAFKSGPPKKIETNELDWLIIKD